MNLTSKQIQIMQVVCSGSLVKEELWNDLDQILERLEEEFNWHTTKQSIQFSIRSLVEKHGLIEKGAREKRRGRLRVIIKPTELGISMFGDKKTEEAKPQSFVAEEESCPEPISEVIEKEEVILTEDNSLSEIDDLIESLEDY